MKIGIVGLPNVGKSTLFNAVTGAAAEAANYPFCTIEPNVGVVPVPDPRLDFLAGIYHPKKTTPATVEFVDIAGLVSGASKGEGLGNKFLAHIREVDAVVHVVRCFESGDVVHLGGSVDPVRDIGVVETELILSDIDFVERRIEKTEKLLKGDKSLAAELEFQKRLLGWLSDGGSARMLPLGDPEQTEWLRSMPLLSAKPVIYAANLSDDDLFAGAEANPHFARVKTFADSEGSVAFPISARAEAEIVSLPKEERELFMAELGIGESGLSRLIRECYSLLGQISFLTAGEPEVRAWTITRGTKAPAAAGKIHSDFERGFIRAEIVAFNDLAACGSLAAAREKGLLRSEGKEYVMSDGDVTLFRFNV